MPSKHNSDNFYVRLAILAPKKTFQTFPGDHRIRIIIHHHNSMGGIFMDVTVLEALFYPEHLRLWLEADQKRSDKILTSLIAAARRLEGLPTDKACWQIRKEK